MFTISVAINNFEQKIKDLMPFTWLDAIYFIDFVVDSGRKVMSVVN